jgi:hypothetical protein
MERLKFISQLLLAGFLGISLLTILAVVALPLSAILGILVIAGCLVSIVCGIFNIIVFSIITLITGELPG